ncbi:MAG: hypothetical protein K0R28_6029 [Paenibacillus sp.]|nr:hypothetical protein [Paenibacillus sp.]
MGFESDYDSFMRYHEHKRDGERLRRLTEGHGHAERAFVERVWWPSVGSFDWLHPEYEVSDFKDGSRFLDFAYIRFPYRIGIKIDGYGPHLRDVSRTHFADQLMRQNHLVIDGWRVIRFSYDDVMEKPRRCQQTIQQWMGTWFGGERHRPLVSGKMRELIAWMIRRQGAITPTDASMQLGITARHARTLLHRLAMANILLPRSGDKRVRSYILNPDGKHLFL